MGAESTAQSARSGRRLVSDILHLGSNLVTLCRQHSTVRANGERHGRKCARILLQRCWFGSGTRLLGWLFCVLCQAARLQAPWLSFPSSSSASRHDAYSSQNISVYNGPLWTTPLARVHTIASTSPGLAGSYYDSILSEGGVGQQSASSPEVWHPKAFTLR